MGIVPVGIGIGGQDGLLSGERYEHPASLLYQSRITSVQFGLQLHHVGGIMDLTQHVVVANLLHAGDGGGNIGVAATGGCLLYGDGNTGGKTLIEKGEPQIEGVSDLSLVVMSNDHLSVCNSR